MKHINEYSEFKKSLNEGPGKGYYIKVAVRDAKKALSILDDMYRKKFDISGSDTYYFKDEDLAYDAMMDLGARDIQVTDTNIEESLDEKAGPCWDGYKIGSPKTKISSQSGKRVNNCVPIDESEVNEKLARGLKPLLKLGSTITKKAGEDALLDLSDKFDRIDDEYAGTIASWLDMAIELMQDGYAGDATKKLKQFNKKCKDVLNGKDIGSAFESVNEATDMNDPVLMAFRATRRDLPKLKFPKVKSRRLSFDKYMDLLDAEIDVDQQIKDLAQEMGQTLRDMEQEAEPEGGKIADSYGSIMMKQEKEYTKLKAKKAKIAARIEKHRMA
jgi:hypothetical protein